MCVLIYDTQRPLHALLASLEADKARSTEMRALGKAVQLDAEVETPRKGKSKGKSKEVALDGADKSAGKTLTSYLCVSVV